MDTRLFRVIDGIVSVFLGCVNLTCRTSHLNDSKWITLTCGHFRSLNCGTISASDEDVSLVVSSHDCLKYEEIRHKFRTGKSS